VESPVRGDSHAGFGGRPAETERPRGRHRAAGRPYLAGEAADKVRREQYNAHGRSSTGEGKWIKGARYSLLKDPTNQTPKQLLKLADVVLTNKPMYRAFLLYGELRYIYRLSYHEAVERLAAWLAWASRSRLKPFVKLARTIRKHKPGVLAALKLGLSNACLSYCTSW
jgi:transposase